MRKKLNMLLSLRLLTIFKKINPLTRSKIFAIYLSIYYILTYTKCLLCYSPLWWGVLDFREDNFSPCPCLPRAKVFISEQEVNRLMEIARAVIKEGKENISKSAESFLKALLLSDFTGIRLIIAKDRRARGITGLCDLLRESAEKIQVN